MGGRDGGVGEREIVRVSVGSVEFDVLPHCPNIFFVLSSCWHFYFCWLLFRAVCSGTFWSRPSVGWLLNCTRVQLVAQFVHGLLSL